MVICGIDTTPSFILPGMLVIGSAITVTVLAWFQSLKSRGILPKGFKEKKDYLAIFR